MKKVASILAVLVMTIGMVSCETDNNLEETDALYELNVDATDGDNNDTERRGSGD